MKTTCRASTLICAFTSLYLAACASTQQPPSLRAKAELQARSASTVSGTVQFSQYTDKLVIEATISGLTPGEHGFHVHDKGDCSAPDAASAGGHFNPAGKTHGHHGSEQHHAGDLPNLIANSDGKATYRAEINGMTLTDTNLGISSRSVVIHADPDDYRSQPAGNSGKRVACGTILVTR